MSLSQKIIKIAKRIVSTTIVRIPNFSKESDVFCFMADKMEKENSSLTSQVYNKAWDYISNGDKSGGVNAVQSMITRFVKSNWDAIFKSIYPQPFDQMFADSNIQDKVTRIFAVGIMNEMIENPTYYKKFLNKDNVKDVDNQSVQRGKAKFVTMLNNSPNLKK